MIHLSIIGYKMDIYEIQLEVMHFIGDWTKTIRSDAFYQ